MVTVLDDPRVERTQNTLKSQYEAYKQLEKEIDIATEAANALKASDKLMADVLKDLKDKKSEEYDSLKSTTKATQKLVKAMLDELLGEVIDKQGIARSPKPNIMSFYYEPMNYLGASKPVGATEQRLMKQATEKLKPWLEKVNAFYQKEWPTYQKQVEATDFSPFKEVKEFGLE